MIQITYIYVYWFSRWSVPSSSVWHWGVTRGPQGVSASGVSLLIGGHLEHFPILQDNLSADETFNDNNFSCPWASLEFIWSSPSGTCGSHLARFPSANPINESPPLGQSSGVANKLLQSKCGTVTTGSICRQLCGQLQLDFIINKW